MGRETNRRLGLLGIVAVIAAAWTIGVQGPSVTDVAAAASPPAADARMAPCPFPTQLRAIFEAASRDALIPAAMLYAVAKVESNLRPDVESSAGARGLLQVMPSTGRSLALNVDEPRSNVLAGARYLRQLLDRFGSTDLALAAYNAGPTAVAAAGGAPSDGVTHYVANVNAQWKSVAGCR